MIGPNVIAVDIWLQDNVEWLRVCNLWLVSVQLRLTYGYMTTLSDSECM